MRTLCTTVIAKNCFSTEESGRVDLLSQDSDKKAGACFSGFFYVYFYQAMKKSIFLFVLAGSLTFLSADVKAQCSVCTRTTEQMGEKPAGKINAGILYLAATPLLIAGIVGYRWWKRNGD